MSAETLEAALREMGLDCAVEARQGLALLTPRGDAEPFVDPRLRRAAAALLPEHGFTHFALELLGEQDDRAALPRD